jgi:4'-phosphopantetheinyl transferase
VPGDLRRACADWLSEDERARASGHRIEKLRRRFIVRRGLRRALLARYLGARPEDLRFAYGSKDKPRLAGDRAREDLQFNCSHSAELALIAVTRGREIGVDVERVRDDVRCTELATRYFAPAEAMALARETAGAQRALFFRYWTGKEAWIKAEGGGLSIPLRQFEVRFSSADRPAPVVSLANASGDLLGYVYPLRVAEGYVAALAAAEPGLEIQLRQWTPEMALQRAV